MAHWTRDALGQKLCIWNLDYVIVPVGDGKCIRYFRGL